MKCKEKISLKVVQHRLLYRYKKIKIKTAHIKSGKATSQLPRKITSFLCQTPGPNTWTLKCIRETYNGSRYIEAEERVVCKLLYF